MASLSLSRGKGKNKRRRTEEEEDEQDPPPAPHIIVKLPEEMRAAMGGRKYCKEEELTREVMLQYLKAKGEIKEVEGLVDVTVQTMTGHSFGIVLEAGAGAQVHVLKDEIKQAEGIPVKRQDLLMLSIEGGKGGQGSGEPLAGDFVIEADCTVALCVASPQGKVLVKPYFSSDFMTNMNGRYHHHGPST